MIISNNNLLNILLPNDNKLFKEILQNADKETLENFKNGNVTVKDLLNNLFDSLKSGEKTTSNIESLLKNSNIFKEDVTFTKSISNLLEQIKTNPSLEKFTPILQALQKDITSLKDGSLKEMINKSGIFLESKLLEQATSSNSIPKSLESNLNEIKNFLKSIPSPQGQKIEELINNLQPKTLQSRLNEVINSLKNYSQVLTPREFTTINNLTTNLQNLLPQAQLVESTILNNTQNPQNLNEALILKQNINTQTTNVLTQIRNELLLNNIPNAQNLLRQIDLLLISKDMFSKIDLPFEMANLNQNSAFQSNFTSNINSLILNLKESINSSNPEVFKLVEKLEHLIQKINITLDALSQKQQSSIQHDMKAVLLQMQGELSSKNDPASIDNFKQIDRLITQIEYNQLLSIVSSSNSVYVPFLWDMLDEGSISMKKTDEEKFYCEINLSLKEFGQTNLLLALYDKNKLDLTIYTSKDSFKQTIKENFTKLKQSLNSVNIIPVNIKIIDIQKEETKESKQLDMFNQNNNTNFGIDIRV